MTMISTGTRSASFTITDAREVGARVGADLRLLNSLYGQPTLPSIDDYAEEVALLLRDGYLRTVDYGFKDTSTNVWKVRLRYTATTGRQLVNSRPGSLPTNLAVAEYGFYSFLAYSTSFDALNASYQAAILADIPVNRVSAAEPSTGAGTSRSGHGYARNGVGLTRDVFTAA
jgi:Bacterial HORMA domain family 1